MAAGGTLAEYLIKLKFASENADAAHQATEQTRKDVDNTKKSVKGMSSALNGIVKQLLKTVVGFATLAQAIIKVASAVKQNIKYSLEMNATLDEQAKSLNKTYEGTRAHLLALNVMGKTMDEINKSQSLKKMYDDLTALGKKLALPEAAKGVKGIQGIRDAITKLKYTSRYVIEWTSYYLQKYLKTTLEDIKKMIFGDSDSIDERVKKFSSGLAKVLAYIIDSVRLVVQDVKKIFNWLSARWGDLSSTTKKSILALVAVLTLVLNKGLALKALIVGLIAVADGFIHWIETGEEEVEGFNEKLMQLVLGIYNFIANVWNGIADIIVAIYEKVTHEEFELPIYIKTIGYEDAMSKIEALRQNGGAEAGASEGGAKGTGGIVTKPTRLTVGDEGTEYIIPMNKKGTAKNMIADAARMLGMRIGEVSNYTSAQGSTSGYSTTNNSYGGASVNAPATINVYGSDPVATANQINRKHEELIVRNLSSVLA